MMTNWSLYVWLLSDLNLSGILFGFLVYVLYVLATMYLYVYVSTWVYDLLDFD